MDLAPEQKYALEIFNGRLNQRMEDEIGGDLTEEQSLYNIELTVREAYELAKIIPEMKPEIDKIIDFVTGQTNIH